MNQCWRKRVSTIIVSVILLSLISFGGITASSPLHSLISPHYHSTVPFISHGSNDSTSSLESVIPRKFTNSKVTMSNEFNSFDAHEQDTVSKATYNLKLDDLNTVSTVTYDMKSKDNNTVHVVKELIEKRTRNSKSFLNNDGTTTVQTSVYSLNYFDGLAWRDIDTTIQSDNTDSNYTHSMLANNFKVRLHNKGNNQAVTFSVFDQSITYKAENMNNVTGIVYGDTVTYPNAWQSTDLQYQVQNDQLKMELHLDDNKAPKMFAVELKMKGVKHLLNIDGSIDFVDKYGKVNFKIPQMWVRDASSDEKRYDRLKVDVMQKGSKMLIVMTLDDKGLHFPITIDPTTELISNVQLKYYYDVTSRLISIASYMGVIDFKYDSNGNLIKKTRYQGITNINPMGLYQIQARHSGKVLDVMGVSTANGAKIQQFDYVGGDNQKWSFEDIGNGYYRIKAKHSGKVLDVSEVSTNNGATIKQYEYVGGDNQKWQILDMGDGYIQIRAKHSGKVLDVTGVSPDNGANIQQYEYLGGNNQKWKLIQVESLITNFNPTVLYEIKAKNSGKVLDVTGVSTANGAKIQQFDYVGGDNQKWSFEDVGNGYYRIKAKHSGKVLDVSGASTANGTTIQQFEYVGGDNQKWQILDIGDGYVQIRAKHSGKVLDVTGLDNGAILQQYEYLGGNNQKWKLIEV